MAKQLCVICGNYFRGIAQHVFSAHLNDLLVERHQLKDKIEETERAINEWRTLARDRAKLKQTG